MSYLFILNNEPYDGSDKTWNALRLAQNLHEAGESVRIFLMNDSVDLARDVCTRPETYDTDLVEMLKGMYASGVELRVCGTCQARCGIYKNEPYFDPDTKSTMKALREWVQDSDQTLTF